MHYAQSLSVPSKLVNAAYINSVPPAVRYNKSTIREEPRNRKEPRDRKESRDRNRESCQVHGQTGITGN